MNPYEELGVSTDATIDEINAAYRRKARGAHPDAGGTTDTFERLSRAVSLLRDGQRRQRFDETGSTDEPSHNQRSAAVEMLIQTFQQSLAGAEVPEIMDVMAMTKNSLHQLVRNIDAQLSNLSAQRDKFERAMGRLSHKAEGPDFVRASLQSNIAGISKAMDDGLRHKATVEEAIELADSYGWQTDHHTSAAYPPGFGRGGFYTTTMR